MHWLTFLMDKSSVSAFLKKKRYTKVQKANFFFQVRCFIYKGYCPTRQYLTLFSPYPHHWFIYPIVKSLVSTILEKRTYAKLQKANFSFWERYFICKGYCLTRQYSTLFPPHCHPKIRMSASNVVKKRYQNFIITPEANSRAYKIAMPYVFKAGGFIAGHNANLVS